MDFENIITPFVIRNNNEETIQISKGDVIQISSESDVGEEGELRLSQSLKNNNNSPVKIGFTNKCIDIRNCYEFIGLEAQDDHPKRGEEVPEHLSVSEHNHVHQLEKKKEVIQEPFLRMSERCNSNCPPPYVYLKINLRQRIKQCESRTRRRVKYQEFKRQKKNLTKILLLGDSHSRLDILTLIRVAMDHIKEMQKVVEENVIVYSKEERKNFLLREKLNRLTVDDSYWPYNVEVSSDQISIKKMVNKFTF